MAWVLHPELVFLVAMLPGVLTIILTYFIVRRKKQQIKQRQERQAQDFRRDL